MQQLFQLTKVVPNLPCEYLRIPVVGFLSAVGDSVVLILNSGMWVYFQTSPNSGLVLEVEAGLLRQVVRVAGQEVYRADFHQMPWEGLSDVLR